MSPFVLHPRPRPALSHRATLPFVYNPSAPPFVPSHTVPVLVPRPGFPASPDTHIHHIHNDHHYHTRQPYLPPPPQPAMDPVLAREHAYRLQLQYPSGSWRPPAPVVPDLSAPSRQQTQRTQVPQKVWILDCTSCGTFLTNRGMKAVLLLHPSVSLYSTDALPANCSPWEASSSKSSAPSSSNTRRTCECLTQTLCCHGCGTGVGYVIVSPCARCTAQPPSLATTQPRTTNGHRFVFYSKEVEAVERGYVGGEEGVVPYNPAPAPGHTHSRRASTRWGDYSLVGRPRHAEGGVGRRVPELWEVSPALSDVTAVSDPVSDDSVEEEYEGMPPLEGEGEEKEGEVVEALPTYLGLGKEEGRRLGEGETVYWHHLVRGGEMGCVREEWRARLGRGRGKVGKAVWSGVGR